MTGIVGGGSSVTGGDVGGRVCRWKGTRSEVDRIFRGKKEVLNLILENRFYRRESGERRVITCRIEFPVEENSS